MFQRLLVPLDGSQLAESVLPAVRRLAELVPCQIKLLHVIEKRPPSSIHGDTHLQDVTQAEVYLATIADRLRSRGLEVDTHVHTVPQGDVPRCIAEHSEQQVQDLIVLCSHGSGGMRRFVFGSNAEQVLTYGTTPVLLIQPNEQGIARPLGPERVLVLLDITPATQPGLTIGSELTIMAHARFHLLAVVPTLSSISAEQAATGRLIPHTTRHLLDLAAAEAATYLQQQVDQLVARKIAASGRVERGDPGSIVVTVARECHADLLIMPVRGLAGLSALGTDAMTRKVAGAYDGALLLIPTGRV